MANITDSLNNTAFAIHEYFDSDYSGGHVNCTNLPSQQLAPLTAWLAQHNFRAMVTEFGASNSTGCTSYISNIMSYMESNSQYIGWTAWAAGPFWGTSSPCCTDHARWGSLELGSMVEDGSPSLYETVWMNMIQKHLPKTLVRKGMSALKPARAHVHRRT